MGGRMRMATGGIATAGSAALSVVPDAAAVAAADELFESMLAGWRDRQRSRMLGESIVSSRRRTVRRFVEFTGCWPWQWEPAQLESWIAAGGWAHSTVRSYQGAIAAFLDYVRDRRYGWVAECEQRFGVVPAQICGEYNTAAHVADYEGRPGRRALTRGELQALFDAADDAVAASVAAGRKGHLAAFRDATLFKVCYAFGLRRREVAMLDVADFAANPSAPEMGRLGVCQVRFGKAMRGSPPKRRAVAAVMPWACEALAQYLDEVRPRYDGATAHPALWLTERGGRISARQVDDRFARWRAAAGLPADVSVHCLRHSYISHLIETGVDPLFVQQQVGHSWASTTAVYTHVGSDAKNRMLREALSAVFDGGRGQS